MDTPLKIFPGLIILSGEVREFRWAILSSPAAAHSDG